MNQEVMGMNDNNPNTVNNDQELTSDTLGNDEVTSVDANTTQDDTQLESAREDLQAVLQVGLTVQMVSVIVAFAIKKGKEDFLKKLNDLLLEFNQGLTEDEKKELSEDTNQMIETKAEDLVESLGEQLSEEELKAAIEEMKQIAQQPTTVA